MTQADRAGSMSQNKIRKMRSLLDASVRPYSSRRRAEVVSTAIVHRLSPLCKNRHGHDDSLPQPSQRHPFLLLLLGIWMDGWTSTAGDRI